MKKYINSIRLLLFALVAIHFNIPAEAQKGSQQKKDPYDDQFTFAPVNDNCTDAVPLTVGNSCNTITGTVSGATQSLQPIPCNGFTSPSANDVWYKFIAGNAKTTISVVESASFDAVIELLDSCNGNFLECADNTFGGGNSENIFTTSLSPGKTYFVRVYHWGSSIPVTPTFTICVYNTPAPPQNDECAGAISLIVANSDANCASISANTYSATPSQPVEACTGNSADDDIWYYFTATDTTITVAAQNLSIGIKSVGFVIYNKSCNGQASAECDTQATMNLLTFNKLVIGNTYYLRTFTTGSVAFGTFDLCIYKGLPSAPKNDFCSNAINLIPDSACIPITGSVVGATESFPADSCDGYVSATALDVWYKFVATSNFHIIHISESAAFDAVLTLYDGCGGNVIACADKNSSGGSFEDIFAKNLTPGKVYFIRVFDWGSNPPITPNFNICVQIPANPPANDDCANAISIVPGINEANCKSIHVSTVSATKSSRVPACSLTSYDDDVWYSFTATDTAMTVKASNLSNGLIGFGLVLYADSCSGAESIECTTQATNNYQIFHKLTKGKVYYLRTFTTGASVKGTYDLCPFFGWPAPPPNDNCNSAIILTPGVSCNPHNADTYGATASMPSTSCKGSNSPSANDVWFSFTAASVSENIKVKSSSGFDAVVLLYDSCGGNLLDCSDYTVKGDSEIIRAKGLKPGNNYLVRVYHFGSISPATSTFDICIVTPPPPPVNDNCAAAIAISVAPTEAACSFTNVNTNSASASSPIPSCSATSFDDDVWYYFVATDSSVTVKAQNLSAGLLGVGFVLYRDSCSGMQSVECTSQASNNQIIFKGLISGHTYFLRTFTTGAALTGKYDLCLYKGAATPPSNDNCNTAKGLSISTSCIPIAGTLVGATQALPADSCNGSNKSKTAFDVWYFFTPTSPYISIEVSGSGDFNPVVLLYDSCGGNIISCADANANGFEKITTLGLITGKKYLIRIYHNGVAIPNSTNFNICVYLTPPPPINDNCSGAINLSVGPISTCIPVTGDIKNATTSFPANSCNGASSSTAFDVWFTFTAISANQSIEVSGSASLDAVIVLYDSCGGNVISCSDKVFGGGTTEILSAKNLQLGKKYFVRVYPFANMMPATTTFSICVYDTPTPPINDDCSGSISITQNIDLNSCTYTNVSTINALKSTPIPVCASTSADDDVWYSFTAIDTVVNVKAQNLSTGLTGVGYTLYKSTCTGTSPGCISPAPQNMYRFHGITIGTKYYLRTFTEGNTKTGTFDLCVYGGQAIENDDCNKAFILSVDTSCKATIGYSSLATKSMPADSCNPANKGSVVKDVWYNFTANRPNINIKVIGTIGFNAHVQLFDACGGNLIYCSDSTLKGGTEFIRARGLTVGHNYQIRIYNYSPPVNPTEIFTVCVYSVGPVGIEKLEHPEHLEIFPNPAHSELNISLKNQEAGKLEIRILNLSGQILFQSKTYKTNTEFNNKINISEYPIGIYFMQVITDKWVENRKIIRE